MKRAAAAPIRPARISRHEPVFGIGQAAARLGITPMALRVYERRGLVIPERSATGRRFFSLHDIEIVRCARELIMQEGLNIEGIRHLLALIPCRKVKRCSEVERSGCEAFKRHAMPCWAYATTPCRSSRTPCRECPVYKNLPGCRSIKARLSKSTNRKNKEVMTEKVSYRS